MYSRGCNIKNEYISRAWLREIGAILEPGRTYFVSPTGLASYISMSADEKKNVEKTYSFCEL